MELEIQYKLVKSGLMIHYTATTDAPTVCSLTNHSYFNLNGHASGTALGHRVSLYVYLFWKPTTEAFPPAGAFRWPAPPWTSPRRRRWAWTSGRTTLP